MSDEPALCHVTTTGRRSGRPHTIEIWFARSGDSLYLLAGGRHRADWVRNLVATPEVQLRISGQDVGARARVLQAGTSEDALARRLLLDKYQAPGAGDLETWGRSALAVVLDLPPGGRPEHGA